jgi:hypothetical protein
MHVASLQNVRPRTAANVPAVQRPSVVDLYLLMVYLQRSSAQIVNFYRYFVHSGKLPVSRLGRSDDHFLCLELQHLFLSHLVLHVNGIVL